MHSIPPPAASLLEPGFRLDRYELLCKIGQGGMASVWLAREAGSTDGGLVAIKTILPEHAAHDAFRSMMLDEARVVRLIDHPNVAATLEVGEIFGAPYLVLEYVPGESLDQLADALAMAKKHVPAPILARVLADACRGLHAAHELALPGGENLGLVHRDLSPQNVLVDVRGRAKLIDFGVAKAAERLTPDTQSGVMKGKIPFMALEQARGEDVDRRADVWAAGAIAYYLLSGRYPHDGPNDAARLIRKLTEEPPEPLPDDVPEALARVVGKALASAPDDRYPTAAALADALEEAVVPATHEEVARFFTDTLAATQRAREVVVEHAIASADAKQRVRDSLYGGATSPTSVRPPPPVEEEPPKRSRLPMVLLYAGVAALLTFAAFVLGSLSTKPAEGTGRPESPPRPTISVGILSAAPSSGPSAAGPAASATTPSPSASVAADPRRADASSTNATPPPPPPPPSASTGRGKRDAGREVEDTIF